MQILVFVNLQITQLLMDTLLFYFPSEYSVPLERISETQLTLCHPERELLPLVLAHCHYTLEKGGETDSSYDLPSIQTQVARRFLAGKPLIQAVKKQNKSHSCMQTSGNMTHSANQHCCFLFDQDISRYLNRHLQDFSVVLREVRGKIPQVRLFIYGHFYSAVVFIWNGLVPA